MKRTASDKRPSSVNGGNGGAVLPHQQTANTVNAAQDNGGNATNVPPVRMMPMQVPNAVPGMPTPPPGMPPLPLTQPPQWRQPGPGMTFPPLGMPPLPLTQPPQWQQPVPGMTAPVLPYAAPLPASASRMSSAAPGAIGAAAIPIGNLTTKQRVDAAIAKDPEAWHREFAGLQGEERLRFSLESIDGLGEHWCPRLYNWRDVLLGCCQMVGLQRLLIEPWSYGGPLISLLVQFGFNALLAEALNTEAGRATLLKPDKSGNTALHVAAEYSNFEAARLLLSFDDAQGTLRMKPNFEGILPIHRAAYFEAPDIVALLLALKGKEQRLAAAGSSGRLPIHEATMGSKLQKTQLPKGSVPFWTPILSRNGDVAVVRTLLEDCAHEQVTARISSWGGIPLMCTDSPEVAALLLGSHPHCGSSSCCATPTARPHSIWQKRAAIPRSSQSSTLR
jgi:hypothetical protein